MANALRIVACATTLCSAALLAASVPVAGGHVPALLITGGLAVVLALAAVARGVDVTALLLSGAGSAAILSSSALSAAGGSLARGAAVASAPLVLPLAGAALIRSRRLLSLALAGGLLAGPLRALVYDPFLDPSCRDCRPSALVLTPSMGLANLLLLVGGLLTVVALGLAAWSWGRRLPLAVLACATAASTAGVDSQAVLAGGVLIAALTIAADAWVALCSRRRIEELVAALHDRAELTSTLRESLADPDLTVAYWLEDECRFVASDGDAPPGPLPGQTATDLRVGTRLTARIHHDAGTVGVERIAAALDAPARLVLENEALAARLAARASELAASRARIVDRADAERRQIERDIHDGAQQHVLALGFDLRVAITALPAGDRDRPMLETCLVETMAALDDLRKLSQGLCPPSLSAGGLSSALRAMARNADAAIDIETVPRERFSQSAEQVAYALIADAAARTSEGITVAVRPGGSPAPAVLSVRIDGATGLPAGVLPDRVAAIGGTLERDGRRTVAVLPCG